MTLQKLHLVGLTTDRRGLIFSTRRGSRSGTFTVPVDRALLDAVERVDQAERSSVVEASTPRGVAASRRRDAGIPRGAPEPLPEDEDRPEQSSLSVREVQALLRRGHSIAEVARAAGVSTRWVGRFAAPVLAERSAVLDEARSARFAAVRRGPSGAELAESVRQVLVAKGVREIAEAMEQGWTVRQLDGEEWLVGFAYRNRGRSREARWRFQRRSGRLVAENRVATELGYVDPAPGAVPGVDGGAAVVDRRAPNASRSGRTTGGAGRGGSTAGRAAGSSTGPTPATQRTATTRKATARKATTRKPATRKATTPAPQRKPPSSKPPTGGRASKAARTSAATSKATTRKASTSKATTRRATSKNSTARTRTGKKNTAKRNSSKKNTGENSTAKRNTSKKSTGTPPAKRSSTSAAEKPARRKPPAGRSAGGGAAPSGAASSRGAAPQRAASEAPARAARRRPAEPTDAAPATPEAGAATAAAEQRAEARPTSAQPAAPAEPPRPATPGVPSKPAAHRSVWPAPPAADPVPSGARRQPRRQPLQADRNGDGARVAPAMAVVRATRAEFAAEGLEPGS